MNLNITYHKRNFPGHCSIARPWSRETMKTAGCNYPAPRIAEYSRWRTYHLFTLNSSRWLPQQIHKTQALSRTIPDISQVVYKRSSMKKVNVNSKHKFQANIRLLANLQDWIMIHARYKLKFTSPRHVRALGNNFIPPVHYQDWETESPMYRASAFIEESKHSAGFAWRSSSAKADSNEVE